MDKSTTDVWLTAPELIQLIEEAGQVFAWSRSYRSVMGTAVGAAFAAANLDEESDPISVSPDDVAALADKIEEDSLALGRKPRTAAAYAISWRRLATIGCRWKTGGGAAPNAGFWDTATDLRDQRKRRLGKPDNSSWRFASPVQPGNSPASTTIVVELASGTATVELPASATDGEIVEVIRAVLGHQNPA